MKHLKHSQTVRIAGHSLNKVTVTTLQGYVAEQNARYAPEFAKPVNYFTDLDYKFDRPTTWAWAYQAPGVIEADYPGKAEALAAERAEIETAPFLYDGEEVQIEGRVFKVKINGNCSDPVKFVFLRNTW